MKKIGGVLIQGGSKFSRPIVLPHRVDGHLRKDAHPKIERPINWRSILLHSWFWDLLFFWLVGFLYRFQGKIPRMTHRHSNRLCP